MKKKLKVLLGIMLILVLTVSMTVFAEGEDENGKYSISVSVSGVDEAGNYRVTAKVGSKDTDFSGIVRISLYDDQYDVSAYDTEISIAKGTDKDLKVSIPSSIISSPKCIMKVSIVSKNNKVLYNEVFRNMFSADDKVFEIGVLSDNFYSLTYLDFGGDVVNIYGGEYYIELDELDPNELDTVLDNYKLLVIDTFDTNSLKPNAVEKIEKWVNNGGLLVIGTGASGDKTFSAFDKNFIDAKLDIKNRASEGDANNNDSAYTYPEFINGLESTVDVVSITCNSLPYNYNTTMFSGNSGDGSICLLQYSLTDEGIYNGDSWYNTQMIYETAVMNSNMIISNSNQYDFSWYNVEDLYSALQGKMDLNIGTIKFILFFFICLISPLLYLALKKMNKNELYWILVPAFSLLALGLVYITGRGLTIKETQAYSVTINELGTGGYSNSYISCYSPKNDEWEITLDKKFANARIGHMSYAYPNVTDDYKYRFQNSVDGYKIGYVPSGPFSESSFAVVGENSATGSIDMQDVEILQYAASGKITNNTPYNFYNAVVINNDYYMIIGELKAGETIDLLNASSIGRAMGNMDDVLSLYYQSITTELRNDNYDNAAALAAINVAIIDKHDFGSLGTEFYGVLRNYDKVTNDKDCNETSYGVIVQIDK